MYILHGHGVGESICMYEYVYEYVYSEYVRLIDIDAAAAET